VLQVEEKIGRKVSLHPELEEKLAELGDYRLSIKKSADAPNVNFFLSRM